MRGDVSKMDYPVSSVRNGLSRTTSNSIAQHANRTLFRGYGRAYAALAALLILHTITATVVGVRVFGMPIGALLDLGNMTRVLPGMLAVPLIWIGFVAVSLAVRSVDRPTVSLMRIVRFRSDWLLRGALLLMTFPVMGKAFATLKSAIPSIVPFYLDPYLVDFDIWLLGTDAWAVTHAITPPWFLIAIDRVYILWFTYAVILTGIVCFSSSSRDQITGALAIHACWIIIGNLSATALSSVGPVFYDQTFGGSHFANLISTLRSADVEHGLMAADAMDFLLGGVGTASWGVGISAMPSMHLSMAFLGVLVAWRLEKHRWLKLFTAAFTLATLVGSVHLGWHYLSDGLLSIALTIVIWWALGRFVDWSYNPNFRNLDIVSRRIDLC